MRARRSSFFVGGAAAAVISALAGSSPAAPAPALAPPAGGSAEAAEVPALEVSLGGASVPMQPAAPEGNESSVLPPPGEHNLKSCSGTKKLCGIQNDNICCDAETECCVRRSHHTVCKRKRDKC